MDPNIQEIITRFKQLDTNSARRIVYHQIIDQLGPHEWRDAKKRINERSFQKDILGSLPLEVAVQIIQFLGLNDAACSILFRQYTGGALDDNFKATFSRYSQHRLRIEKGIPFRQTQVDVSLAREQSTLSFDYSDGRYAWSTDDDTTIVVYELCSKTTRRFCTENRAKFMRLRVSGDMVVAITIRGHLHAWDLHTEETHTVRLPNTNISQIVISGFRVAIHLMNNQVLMHLDLQPGNRGTHNIQQVQDLAHVGLDSSPRFLTTVCLEQHKNRLRVVKHELHENGESSAARSYTLELPPAEGLACLGWDWQYNCKNIGFVHGRDQIDLIVPITYHPQTEQVCVHTLPDRQIARPPCIANVDNGIIYWVKDDDGKQSIWISNPYADTPLYASQKLDLPRPPSDEASLMMHTSRVLIGDSRVISIVDTSGTLLSSFVEQIS
ncbi:F-box domain protein [Aspergillus mulundensis]|uniref:F-box domain-containing protein n=1 Tax=Aspergillus mulundensis TaxID=1810919 RepID=A0A3D8QZ85_9EURO|nr:hypothetical protein DSM5745_08982 [Aspergillus mulundensis]RDW67116.1 hypothetical protein DSM5745_08982 [Aspergillus mulundensis]